VAADGEGANGLYTEELLKALRVPGLKVEEVFKQVRVGVTTRSKGAQTPWESSSLTGDFVVNAAVNVTAPAAPPPTSSAALFDGLWAVTIDCPRTSAGSSGAEGYVIQLLAKVKDGALHGQRGSEGQANSLTLVGKIQPDGHAALSARGMTGDPKHSVNREAAGVPYAWRATALFEGSRGIGKKTDIRPCDLTFVKK
jgi:caspase domain-containing protein